MTLHVSGHDMGAYEWALALHEHDLGMTSHDMLA